MTAKTIDHLYLAEKCLDAYDRKTGSNNGVEWLHIAHNHFHIFAIRGTSVSGFLKKRGWKDLIRDFAFLPKRYKKTYIAHFGFAQGWVDIKPEVDKIIMQDTRKPIIFAGHSMGGSIAICAAIGVLINPKLKLHSVITFGAPRVIIPGDMDEDLRINLETSATQYQNSRDPIPGLMRWTCYKHINNTFIGGYKRYSYFERRIRFHPMKSYRDLIRNRSSSNL